MQIDEESDADRLAEMPAATALLTMPKCRRPWKRAVVLVRSTGDPRPTLRHARSLALGG